MTNKINKKAEKLGLQHRRGYKWNEIAHSWKLLQ